MNESIKNEKERDFIFTDEGVFQRYCEDLELNSEDLKKKILDVGSGACQFAKFAEDSGISNQIYSINATPDSGEPFGALPFQESKRSTVGKAEALPYKDESFDLVISEAALPILYCRIENDEQLRETLEKFLTEMLRVAKADGEVRFGRVSSLSNGKLMSDSKRLRITFDSVLEDIKSRHNLEVKIKTADKDVGGEFKPLDLIKIRKILQK